MASYYLYNYSQHARMFRDEDIPDVVAEAGRLAIIKNLPLIPVILSQIKDSQSNNFERAWQLAGQSTVGNTENSIGLLQFSHTNVIKNSEKWTYGSSNYRAGDPNEEYFYNRRDPKSYNFFGVAALAVADQLATKFNVPLTPAPYDGVTETPYPSEIGKINWQTDIEFDYHVASEINLDHAKWDYAVNVLGFVEETGELTERTAYHGHKCVILRAIKRIKGSLTDDATAYYQSPWIAITRSSNRSGKSGPLGGLGITQEVDRLSDYDAIYSMASGYLNDFRISPDFEEDGFEIHYQYWDSVGDVQQEIIIINKSELHTWGFIQTTGPNLDIQPVVIMAQYTFTPASSGSNDVNEGKPYTGYISYSPPKSAFYDEGNNRGGLIKTAGSYYDNSSWAKQRVLEYWAAAFFASTTSGGSYDSAELFEENAVWLIDSYNSNFPLFGSYFPVIQLRMSSQNITEEYDPDQWAVNQKLLKTMGLSQEAILDAVYENPEGTGDLSEIHLQMSVDMNSDNQTDMAYTFDWWKARYDQAYLLEPRNTVQDIENGLDAYDPLEYGFSEKFWFMTLTVHSISFRYKIGSIGDVGTYEKEVTRPSSPSSFLDPPPGYNNFYDNKISYPSRNGDVQKNSWDQLGQWQNSHKYWVYRKQVAPNIYQELIVKNPLAVYYGWDGGDWEGGTGRWELDGIGGNRRYRTMNADLSYAAGINNMFLPVDMTQLASSVRSIKKRNEFYYRNYRLYLSSWSEVKVEWYETEEFADFIMVVGFALAIFTFGESIALATTIIALLEAIAVWVLTTLIISFIAKTVVRLVGIEAALIIATIAMLLGGFAGDTGLLSAENLFLFSSGLSGGVQTNLADKMEKLEKNRIAWELSNEERFAELEQYDSLINTQQFIEPYAFIRQEPIIIPGEEAEQYYERIFSGNIGVLTYDIVNNYVDINLRLPTFHDSLGNSNYA